MSIVIISDTSCLIALDRVSQLGLLQQLFQHIVITQVVEEEFGKKLPEWIRTVEVQNQDKVRELEAVLDKGEASVIALALETEKGQLIIDEKKGRKVAQSLEIEVTGTLKVILMAKQKGIIQSVRPVIEDLQKAGFRFSQKIINILLEDE